MATNSSGPAGGKGTEPPPLEPPGSQMPCPAADLLDDSLRGSSACSNNTVGDRSKSGSDTPRRDPPPPSDPPGTPPYAKWAKSFHYLLEDREGHCLFQQYLQGEDVLNYLMFWYAVNGFKSQADKEKKYRLAKVISRTFIRKTSHNCLGGELASDNRRAILGAIKSNNIDNCLFERAQCEIEGFLEHKAYPNFLRSDVYLEYCNKAVAAAAAAAAANKPDSSPSSGSNSARNTIVGGSVPAAGAAAGLPTVHEDTELLCKEINQNGGNKGIEATPADFADPSPPSSRGGNRQSPAQPCTSHTCQRNASNKGSHVYTTLPPAHSANDSEIQSLSSDTHTDDSLSLADSSLDVSGLPPGRRLQHMVRKDKKHMKYSANLNGHHARMFPHMPHMLRSGAAGAEVRPGQVNPRQVSEQNMTCEQFAALLIEKLQKVQAEREARYHDRRAADYSMDGPASVDLNSTSVSDGALASGGKRTLTSGALMSKTPSSGPAELEDPESIIDKHVSRVFHDGVHSPVHTRSKTPDRFSTLHTNTHRCTSCGQSTFSQTLPSNYRNNHPSITPGGPTAGGGPPAAPSGRYPRPGPASTYENLHMGGGRSMRYSSTVHRKMVDTSSSGKSTSSGVDSGVYDAQSLGSQDSYCGKNQMVSEWVEHSSRQQQQQYQQVSKPQIALAESGSSSRQRMSSGGGGGRSTTGGTSSRHRFASVSPAPLGSRGALQAVTGGGGASACGHPLTVFNASSAAQSQQRRSPVTTVPPPPTAAQAPPPAAAVSMSTQGSTPLPQGGGGGGSPNPSGANQTVVAYYFCNETIPYRTTVPFRHVTLGQFKGLLTRRGRFRYFFKMRSNEIEQGGVVHEEITDDNAILPLFDGKIIGKIEKQ